MFEISLYVLSTLIDLIGLKVAFNMMNDAIDEKIEEAKLERIRRNV